MMLALVTLRVPFFILASAAPLAKRYSGVQIVSGVNGKCLAAMPKTGSGCVVTTVKCGQSNFPEYWDIHPGSGLIALHGSNLVLDAGSSPINHGSLKVWKSYPSLYQQMWYLTPDHRIAITGGTQCLDEGLNGPQIYTCETGNNNQVWTIRDTGAFSSGSSSVFPSASPMSGSYTSAYTVTSGAAHSHSGTVGPASAFPSGSSSAFPSGVYTSTGYASSLSTAPLERQRASSAHTVHPPRPESSARRSARAKPTRRASTARPLARARRIPPRSAPVWSRYCGSIASTAQAAVRITD